MQAIAAWLIARRLNAILALAATISLSWLSFLSGVVLILLVLRQGARSAVIDAVAAGAMVAVIGLVVQSPVPAVIVGAASVWVPAMLLGIVLATTRSLTLTLQLAVIVAVLAMVGFFLAVGDPAEFWRTMLATVAEVWREAGLTEQADLLVGEINAISAQMTMIAALVYLSMNAISVVLGNKLLRQLPDETDRFGRFRDLNFGRVIAMTVAVASVGAWLSGAVWLQNIAFVLFAIFWLQGLAIVHWMHGEGQLPLFGVIAVYVLAPFLNVLLLIGLAIAGYIDAWFGFRRKRPAT